MKKVEYVNPEPLLIDDLLHLCELALAARQLRT
jgi:hypothetical protein